MSKHIYRGVEQLVARRAHNPEVASSSLVPATTKKADTEMVSAFSLLSAKHELSTGGFPEHNSRALPVAEKAKAVMAQRSNNCHAPSEQLFGHRKSASKGKAFVRKNKGLVPATTTKRHRKGVFFVVNMGKIRTCDRRVPGA